MLADDHEVVREGLRLLIDAQADMVVVGQAGSGHEAVRQALDYRPDVVVMDIAMPHLDGAEATAQIKREYPGVRVLALTRHADQGYLRRMLHAGAAGYVVKKTAADQLIDAIHHVAAGGIFVDPSLSGDLVEHIIGQSEATDTNRVRGALTKREAEVLRLIAWGRSNKEIAAQLSISVKTVEFHKTNAVEKLHLRSRTDILRYALAEGWLQDNEDPE
jgi:DNA-binding NarL/FixJ family response regulator